MMVFASDLMAKLALCIISEHHMPVEYAKFKRRLLPANCSQIIAGVYPKTPPTCIWLGATLLDGSKLSLSLWCLNPQHTTRYSHCLNPIESQMFAVKSSWNYPIFISNSHKLSRWYPTSYPITNPITNPYKSPVHPLYISCKSPFFHG